MKLPLQSFNFILLKPLVTISIPLFKCEDFLEKCLKSVLSQTYQNIEVTLINDQTPDNSVSIAEKFMADHQLQDQWKIYHLNENSGLSVVRNKGIDTAKGKYIFFLDSDDTITPDCIEKLVKLAEQTGAEMTISQLECEQLETGKKSICIKLKTDQEIIEGNQKILTEFANGNLVSYAVNKLILVDFVRAEKIYFIKGLFAQDELWTFHMVLALNKIAIHKGITYTYFLHKKSVIHNRTKRNFDNWQTIGEYINESLQLAKKPDRRNLILKYLVKYKDTTLLMNWKAQKNKNLWMESYRNYKKLGKLGFADYFSADFSMATKKKNFLQNLPTTLGMKVFLKRYNG